MKNEQEMMPVDVAISLHIQNMFQTFGEQKVRNTLKELFNVDVQTGGSAVDKIVLSNDKDRCVVHMVNGMTLHFNFFKMGMTYFEGLDWLNTVFNPQPIQNTYQKAA